MTVRMVSQPPSPGEMRDRIRQSILREMEKVAERGKQLGEQATETWSAVNRPDFAVHSEMDQQQIAVRVAMQAETARAVDSDISVFSLLDEGTDVRYAHMTPDFEAKTTPGSLVSTEGRGGYSHIGFPLPGITARRFSESIAKELEKEMQEAIGKGIAEGLKKL